MPQAPFCKRDNACSTAGTSAGSHLHGAPWPTEVTSSISEASQPGSGQGLSQRLDPAPWGCAPGS